MVFEAVRAKGVREDDRRARLDVGAVDGDDGLLTLDVPIARILADGQPRRLRHRPEPAVKDEGQPSFTSAHRFAKTPFHLPDLAPTSDHQRSHSAWKRVIVSESRKAAAVA